MLIVYDDKGQVEQIITLGGNRQMMDAYKAAGKHVLESFDTLNTTNVYVKNGEILERPATQVQPFSLSVGQETIVSVEQHSRVDVFFNELLVASEDIQPGGWPVEVDLPGSYSFVFCGEFPFSETTVKIEVSQ